MRLLNTAARRKVVETAALQEVLTELRGSDDAKMFEGLKEQLNNEKREELVLKRLGGLRAGIEVRAPTPLKHLRPPIQGARLVYQLSGYYPSALTPEQQQNPRIKKSFSTSRSFGPDRTQEQALLMVVSFLWAKHKQAGGDMSARPTEEQALSSLDRARKILCGEEKDESDDEGEDMPAGAKAAPAEAEPEEVVASQGSQVTHTDDDELTAGGASSSSRSSSSSTSDKTRRRKRRRKIAALLVTRKTRRRPFRRAKQKQRGKRKQQRRHRQAAKPSQRRSLHHRRRRKRLRQTVRQSRRQRNVQRRMRMSLQPKPRKSRILFTMKSQAMAAPASPRRATLLVLRAPVIRR